MSMQDGDQLRCKRLAPEPGRTLVPPAFRWPTAGPLATAFQLAYETSCSLALKLRDSVKAIIHRYAAPSSLLPPSAIQPIPPSGSSPTASPIRPPIHPSSRPKPATMALDEYYHNKIEAMKLEILKGQAALRRLEAQRNDYNSRVRLLREELGLLQQPGSYVGEVVKVMSTKKILVKVHPEGKYGTLPGSMARREAPADCYSGRYLG